jgi:SAM-dependent methyltransferase
VSKWYETFFSGLALEFWRQAVPLTLTNAEVDFIEELLVRSDKKSSLLDVFCGYGRHSLPLAWKGYHVTAVDIAGEYTRALKREARRQRLPLDIIQGDFLKIRLKKRFDAAFCLGNSFGFFDDRGMAMFLKKVAAALKKSGKFLIDSAMAAESILPNLQTEGTYKTKDITLRLKNVYHPERSFLETHYEFIRGRRIQKLVSEHFVYTLAEIKRLLENAGLQTIAVYSSTAKKPYILGSPQLYLVAKKF